MQAPRMFCHPSTMRRRCMASFRGDPTGRLGRALPEVSGGLPPSEHRAPQVMKVHNNAPVIASSSSQYPRPPPTPAASMTPSPAAPVQPTLAHSAHDQMPTGESCIREPLLPALPGEPMTAYFKRLLEICEPLRSQFTRIQNMPWDGIYIHKRPLRGPSGHNPLAVCGSVFHHALIYIKEGDKVHCLDFGPANGYDVTANIMEAAPGRKVLSANLSLAEAAQQSQLDDSQPLPYLYCGEVQESLDSTSVKQAISVIEVRSYHALWHNCIHACDLLLRCLTRGRVRSGPLLYDIFAGEVPQPTVDGVIMMIQMMTGRSWVDVCDGSPLTREVGSLLGWSRPESAEQQQQQQQQQACPSDAMDQAAVAAMVALAKAAMSTGVAAAMPPAAADSEHVPVWSAAQSN